MVHGVSADLVAVFAVRISFSWMAGLSSGEGQVADFIMGTWLNPRLFGGRLDLKMFFEVPLLIYSQLFDNFFRIRFVCHGCYYSSLPLHAALRAVSVVVCSSF